MDDDLGTKGNAGGQGLNAGLIVLIVVVGMLVTFLIGNYVLYVYAQKTLPKEKEARLKEENEERKTEARCFGPRRVN
ncbi:unnamed protein product [Rhodiola kirilowii]